MAFDAYLTIPDIPGESTSESITKRAGGIPIEIKDYSLGLEMPVNENRSAVGAATSGRAAFNEFECSKSLDKATAKLCEACMSGKHIKIIYCDLYRSIGDTEKVAAYLEVEFHDCIITEVSVQSSGDELPTESLKFNYGKVKYKYTAYDHDTGKASSKGNREFTWNQIANSDKI